VLVLVANLGSTSFKYKLLDMPHSCGEPASAGGSSCASAGVSPGSPTSSDPILRAEGAADRLGLGNSAWSVTVGSRQAQGKADLKDHADAIELHLAKLLELGGLKSIDDLQAIGFKAVHGGPISGAVLVDDHVLAVQEQFADVAPQHNPPYIAAMRAFRKRLPAVPQVAAFETAFHQTIPPARQVYGIPAQWTNELGIRRYGFHGASHRYIAGRMAQLSPNARRVISCHLGGSSSICAIHDGKSVANSFGMTAQSGVFHASRVGDFDTFALLKLLKSGLDLDTIWKKLGKEAGLAGLSGISADMREVRDAAAKGNAQAQLACDAFVESIRHFVGAYLVALHGADALVFTGGIGQNDALTRAQVCQGLDFAGITLDTQKNDHVPRGAEMKLNAGPVEIWVLPTNEELVVARQTVEVVRAAGKKN
jgi:acetate kinase